MAAMTVKMDRFCQEYVIDYNGTEAAIRAGYSDKRAASQASTLLKREDVMERIAQLQKEQAQRLGLSADRVVMELWEIYRRCMQAEPVMEWDAEAHSYVPSEAEYTFDANGAVKALKLIGEHIGMWNRKELKLTDETA
ncbi:MAG: terminase small subunit, partial [Faecousia sp.]